MAASDDELPPEDRPTEDYQTRLPAETSFQRWLLFEVNRWVPAGLILFVVGSSFVVAGYADLVSFRNESTGSLLLSAVVAGNFTLVSVVVTIHQLVLSREFGKPHTLRDRNEGIIEYRNDVVRLTGGGAGPADPLVFVRRIARSLEDRTAELSRLVADSGNDPLVRTVDGLAARVAEDAAETDAVLEGAKLGTFDVLTTLLFFRIAWQLHAVRRVRAEYEADLSDRAADVVREIERLLQDLNVARQYLQTLYLQNELGRLSRLLLYVGIPSLVAAALGMLIYRPGSGVTVGSDRLVPVFSAAVTAGFVPLAILLSYVVRISTIVSRMPLLNPFLTDG